MLIGILETGHAPEQLQARHGDYGAMFERLLGGRGFSFRRYDVEHGELPQDPAEADAWLITGSRHGVNDPLPWIAPLEAFIRKAREAHVPVVGICFGHQLLAKALGGKVERHPGGWIVGPQSYDFGGRSLRLNAWHQDQVTRPPADARTIATGPDCAHAALAYGDWAISLQAHPEFDDAFLAGLIDTRGRGVVPEPRLEAGRAALGPGPESDEVARMLAEFLTRARRAPAREDKER